MEDEVSLQIFEDVKVVDFILNTFVLQTAEVLAGLQLLREVDSGLRVSRGGDE